MEQLFDWKGALERETLLTEAYFGETPGIQKLQDAITRFRKRWGSERYKADVRFRASEELDDICTAIEDEFGFGTAVVLVEPTVESNAFSLSIGMRHDDGNPQKWVKKTKDGYKYDKAADYTAMFIIWGGLILNTEKYTDREVCAILLHEVGHNFSCSVNKRIAPLSMISRLVSILSLYPLTNVVLYGTAWKKIDEIMKICYKKYPDTMYVIDQISYFFTMYKNILDEFTFVSGIPNLGIGSVAFKVIRYVLKKAGAITLLPGKIVTLLYGYNDEKFADGFATMYGYGPELHSAMDKMSEFVYDDYVTGHWIRKNMSPLAAYINIVSFPVRLVIQSIDEHPVEMERLYSSIRVLENELADADPKRRKRIQKDLDKLKKELDTYYIHCEKMNKEGQLVDPAIAKRNYYGFMARILGGDFRHFVFDKIFNHEYYLSSKGDKEQ